MFWINLGQVLIRHTGALRNQASQVTSRLFLLLFVVFPHHSHGFGRGEPGDGVGASVGGSVGGGSIGGGSIGGGSFSSSIVIGFGGSESSSWDNNETIEEVIVTAPRLPPSSGVTSISGAALDGWIFSSLASNIGPAGPGSYGSSGDNASQKSNSNFKNNCWQSLTAKPNARVSSGFGYRADPITGVRRLHNGFDLAVETGTPLYAARGGRVRDLHRGIPVGQHGGVDNGNYVRINFNDGSQGVYLHMKTVDPQVGQLVVAGQLIGTSNDTGRSAGAHLHYTIYDGQGSGKKALDPTKAHNQCQSGEQSLAYMGDYGRYDLR